MTKLRWYWVTILAFLVLGLAGCGEIDSGSDDDGGTGGDTSPPAGVQSVSELGISADKFSVPTDNSDFATLTILAKDTSNAGVGGAQVSVSADAGFLSASTLTTDETGQATVTFRAGDLRTVQVVTVTATSGDAEPSSIPISVVGSAININASKTSISANGNDTSTLTITARDSGSDPINGASLTITSSLGNTLVESGGATSGSSIDVTTNTSGSAIVAFSGMNPGSDTITVDGLGINKSITVNVSNATFGFVSPAPNTVVPTNSTQELVVRWTDDFGSPQAGQVLNFTTPVGTFLGSGTNSASTATDSNGEGRVTLQSSSLANPVTIEVSNPAGTLNDTLTLDVRSQNPSRIDLQAFPTVLGPSIGGVSSTSTIRATVNDNSGKAVSGALVKFELRDGPSGGESIAPVSVLTDSGGVAETTFTAGSATSAQDGVVIRATVEGLSGSFGETSLTIGQTASRIVFGTTNKIAVQVSNGLEVAYSLPITVIVTDNNGNAIPNQRVNLGIDPIIFKTGFWDIDKDDAIITGEFKNEDLNSNGLLEENEDGAIGELFPFAQNADGDWIVDRQNGEPTYYIAQDFYFTDPVLTKPLDPYSSIDPANFPPANQPPLPNGKLDPGNVASIPSEITTDDNGLGAFNIVYPKSYGIWVDVKLKASTLVSGSETTAELNETLGVMEGDLPRIGSPFGLGEIPVP